MLTEGAGQWIRAGMDGSIAGLDLAACLARPSNRECDPEMLEMLLTAAEPAVTRAINSRGKPG